jgi:hypothetical protein
VPQWGRQLRRAARVTHPALGGSSSSSVSVERVLTDHYSVQHGIWRSPKADEPDAPRRH